MDDESILKECEEELNGIKSESQDNEEDEEKPKKEKIPFVDIFLNRYAPRNSTDPNQKPTKRYGLYGEMPFTVIETKNSYSVEMEGITKRFTSALTAARWIQTNKFKSPE